MAGVISGICRWVYPGLPETVSRLTPAFFIALQ